MVSERERIAQDLHDLLGQTLTMVALKSEVATRVFDSDPAKAKQELDEIRDAARVALKDVREAVAGMNTTSLRAELKRAQQILSAADIKLTIKGQVPSLNAATDQVLGLTVREAMTNIVRHSLAKHATLNISIGNDELCIVIEDDGVSDAISEGSGLIGLRKRIERLGGSTHFEQAPGLRVSMQIPNWAPLK
jgi:two-component system sensor histidine kinase DesK